METHRLVQSVTEYEEPNQLISHDICLPYGRCFNFIISDSRGDGFSIPGGYQMIADNITLFAGNDFEYMETTTIGSCESCNPFQVDLSIETGNRANKTFWIIRDAQSRNVYYSGGLEMYYKDYTSYKLKYNLCRKKCYQFEVYGDAGLENMETVLNSPFGTFRSSKTGFVDFFVFGGSCDCADDEMRVSMVAIIEGDSKLLWDIFDLMSNKAAMIGFFESTSSTVFCLPKKCYKLSVHDTNELEASGDKALKRLVPV